MQIYGHGRMCAFFYGASRSRATYDALGRPCHKSMASTPPFIERYACTEHAASRMGVLQ